MRKITIFILLAFLLMFCATPAYAQPAFPHAFYGSVTVNGSPAGDGTQVSATVDNGTVIPTQNPVNTAGSSYGIGSLRLLVQGDGLNGAITFYVNGYEATPSEAATFESGGGPDRIDLSVTIAAPAGGGGGGGGGLAPAGTTNVRGMIGTGCSFFTYATAYSEDRICRLVVPTGTVGLTEELECLTQITMLIMDDPPPPPAAANVIGLVYDFQPSRATFEPPITLTFSYDPGDIPEGIAEGDLVLAYYDQKAGEWVNLEGTVATGLNTITVLISHFTGFAILGYEEMPEAAAFTPSSLVISPTEVGIGQTVNVGLSVANTGGMAGSYKVTLKIDGAVEATQEVTVGAGASEEVTFTVSREVAGSYSVDINGLSGSFTVKEEVAPAPSPPPAPPEVKPINWPVVGGIIAAVVILVLLGFFLIRRRRAL